MSQSAVKVLFHTSHSSLQDLLQEFLREQNGRVVITGMTMDSNEYGHCAAILYEAGEGPHYHGQVFFSYQHDGLEEQANGALTAAGEWRPRHVAIGSNKNGHCLTVIYTDG